MSEIDASENYELIEGMLKSARRSPGTTRTLFSSSEKMYLQKLVLKYRIHTKLNHPCRREAWARLTQDFNSIKSFNRTEAQLKKCWDNIKQRRLKKQGRSVQQSVDESQNTELQGAELISDPLMPVKNEPPTWSDGQDNDSTTKEFEVAEVSLGAPAVSPLRRSPGLVESHFLAKADLFQASSPPRESTRLPSGEFPRLSARLQGTTNGTAACNTQHKHNRYSETKTTDRNQESNEELHRLKVAEQVWTLKTVRERYATAQLERERAQLERQRAHEDSEKAKLEVEKARFERDTAQYRSEKALLDLERAKRTDEEVLNRK